MAANESTNIRPLTQFELIQKRGHLSQQETNILNVLTHGLQPASPENAAEAAFQLDRLCPPLGYEEEAGAYLWILWEVILDIARTPDTDNELQQGLVNILQCLKQYATRGEVIVAEGTSRVWEDLPKWSMCVAAFFNDPTVDGNELTPKSAQIWRNLNMFVTRCFVQNLLSPWDDLMYVLRTALEDEPSPNRDIAQLRIEIACGWIFHAALPLLKWAQENIGCQDVPAEDSSQYVEGGPLYQGPQTMCLKRWGFWMDRLEELGQQKSGMSDDTRKLALETVQVMRATERSVAHTLSK